MWVLFRVPCPTPDGRTAMDLVQRRVDWIDDAMRASARAHGCRFHRAWYARDGTAFYAMANWDSIEGARAFFQKALMRTVTTRVPEGYGLRPGVAS